MNEKFVMYIEKRLRILDNKDKLVRKPYTHLHQPLLTFKQFN